MYAPIEFLRPPFRFICVLILRMRLLFWRRPVRISILTPAIMTERCCGFPQSLKTNSRKVYLQTHYGIFLPRSFKVTKRNRVLVVQRQRTVVVDITSLNNLLSIYVTLASCRCRGVTLDLRTQCGSRRPADGCERKALFQSNHSF
jgi:hypothetical protein